MPHTHVILDGLQDPRLGRDLSATWAQAGFLNELDVSGMCARLAVSQNSDQPPRPLTESEARRAAVVARRYGIELRDRAGTAFHGENDLAAVRRQVIHEYRARLAQALVFVGPALAVHYLAPVLAPGSGAKSLVFPWLFEMLLVGWACWVGAWPILWQGALALAHRRLTGDALTTLILVASFAASAAGVLSMLFTDAPWFGERGPVFHAAGLTLLVAVYQRWSAHRHADRIAGRAHWITPWTSRVIGLWILISLVLGAVLGWRIGLSFAMLLPPLFALGGAGALTPGLSAGLPVFGFAAVFLLGPAAMGLDIESVRFEIAAGFAAILACSYPMGWKR